MPLTTYIVQPTDTTQPEFEVEAHRVVRTADGHVNFYEQNGDLAASLVNISFHKKPVEPKTK